jgi:microcystin-dependent protein
MSVTPTLRPARQTPILHLPVPGDAQAADGPGAIGNLADVLDALAANGVMGWSPGDYKFTAARNPPGGWLLCDGRAVSRTVYAALFAAIQTDHGPGDGTSTFNLPDLRGCVPVGAGAGPGLTPRTTGQRLGGESVTLTAAQMPSHGHGVADPAHGHGIGDPTHAHTSYAYNRVDINSGNTGDWKAATGWGSLVAFWGTSAVGTGIWVGGSYTGIGIYGAGGDQAHPNMQPSVVVGNFFIKT